MANTTDTRHTCAECTFFNHGYCVKTKTKTPRIQYACARFMTDAEYLAEQEKKASEAERRNEIRFNFILTALEISATSTQMIIEYFDSLFQDKMVERNWRFERKKAAKNIVACAEKMRSIFQHTFMVDQMNVMTGHGERQFDVTAFDAHEADAANWTLKLFYDLDRCWQMPERDEQVLDLYKSMPDNETFTEQDYRHFAKQR